MSTTTYDVADVARIGNHALTVDEIAADTAPTVRRAFTDINGVAVDPATVTLTVKRPDGTSLVYGWPLTGADGLLTRETTGRFYAEIALSQAGRWRYRLAGTGAASAASEGDLRVQRSRVL